VKNAAFRDGQLSRKILEPARCFTRSRAIIEFVENRSFRYVRKRWLRRLWIIRNSGVSLYDLFRVLSYLKKRIDTDSSSRVARSKLDEHQYLAGKQGGGIPLFKRDRGFHSPPQVLRVRINNRVCAQRSLVVIIVRLRSQI